MDLHRGCLQPHGGRSGVISAPANAAQRKCLHEEPTGCASDRRETGQQEAVERVLTESHVAEQLRFQLRAYLLQKLGACGSFGDIAQKRRPPVATARTEAGATAKTGFSPQTYGDIIPYSQTLVRPAADPAPLSSYLRQECAAVREKLSEAERTRPTRLSCSSFRSLVCLVLDCLKKRGLLHAASILQPEAGLSDADLQSSREICIELNLPEHLSEDTAAALSHVTGEEKSEAELQSSLQATSLLERVLAFAAQLSRLASETESRSIRENCKSWLQHTPGSRSRTVPPRVARQSPRSLSQSSSCSCRRSSSSLADSSSRTCCNNAGTKRSLTRHGSSCSRSASEPSRYSSSASLGRCCGSSGNLSASKCSCSFDSDAPFQEESDGIRGRVLRCYSDSSSETDGDGCSANGCRAKLQECSSSENTDEHVKSLPSSADCLACKAEKRTAGRSSVPPAGRKEGQDGCATRPAVSDRLRQIDEEYQEKLNAIHGREGRRTRSASCNCSRSASSCSASSCSSCSCSSGSASSCSSCSCSSSASSCSSCSCTSCSSGTDLSVRLLRYERECEERHHRQLQNELFRVRTLEASAARLEEGQKARQHLLTYKNELDRLHSERVARLKFQEEAAADRLRKKENEIEQKGYALRQEISAQLKATQQLQRDNKRQWEVEHHALEVRAKALDAREARIREKEERQNQDDKLSKQQLHLRMEEYKRSVELDMQEKATQLHRDRLELERQKQRVELAGEQLTKLETDAKLQAAEIEQLHKTVRQLECTADAEKQAKEQLQESMRLATETADRAKAQMNVYETELQCMKRENSSLQQQLSAKQDRDHDSRLLQSRTMDELHDCLRDSRQTCQDLERKIAVLQDETKRLLQDKERAVSLARNDVERMYSEGMERLKAQLKQEQSARAAKEKELEEARNELERLSGLKLEWQQRAQKLEAAYKASATSQEQHRQLLSSLSATLRLTAGDDELEADTNRADTEARRRLQYQRHLAKVRTKEFYSDLIGNDTKHGSKPVDVPPSPERRSQTPNRTPNNAEVPSTDFSLLPLSSKSAVRPVTPSSAKDLRHTRGERGSCTPDRRIADLEDRVQRFIQSLQNADKLPLSREEEGSRLSRHAPSSAPPEPGNQGSPRLSAARQPQSSCFASPPSSFARWSPPSSALGAAPSSSLGCPFSKNRVECHSSAAAGDGSRELPQKAWPTSAEAPENSYLICRPGPPRAAEEVGATHLRAGREEMVPGTAVRPVSPEATSRQRGSPSVVRASPGRPALQTFPTKSSGEITDSDVTNLIRTAETEQDVSHAVPLRRTDAVSWNASGRAVSSGSDPRTRTAASIRTRSSAPRLLAGEYLCETGPSPRIYDKAIERRSEPCLPRSFVERSPQAVTQAKTGKNKGVYLIRATSVTGRLGDEAESSVIIEAEMSQEEKEEAGLKETPADACSSTLPRSSRPTVGQKSLRAMETRQSEDDVEEGEIRDGETVVGQEGRELIADQTTLRPAASPWLRVVLSPQQKAQREDNRSISPLHSGMGGCAPEDARGAAAGTTTAAASQYQGALAEFASQTSFAEPVNPFLVPHPESAGLFENAGSSTPQASAEVSPVPDACEKPAECHVQLWTPSRQESSQPECALCREPSGLNSPQHCAPGHSPRNPLLESPGLLLSSPSNQLLRLHSSPSRFTEFGHMSRKPLDGSGAHGSSVSPMAPVLCPGCPEFCGSVTPSPLGPASPLISRGPSREASSVPSREIHGDPAEPGDPAMETLRDGPDDGRMASFSRAPSLFPISDPEELAGVTMPRQPSTSQLPTRLSEPVLTVSPDAVPSSSPIAAPQRQGSASIAAVPLSAHTLSRLGSSYEVGTADLGPEYPPNSGDPSEPASPWYGAPPPRAAEDVHSAADDLSCQEYGVEGGEPEGLSSRDGAGFVSGDEIVAAFVPSSDLGLPSAQGASTLVVLEATDDQDTSPLQNGMEVQRSAPSRYPPLSLSPDVAESLEPGELVPNHLFNVAHSSSPFPHKVSALGRSDSTPSPTLRPPSSLVPSSSSPGFVYPLPPRERTPQSHAAPSPYMQALSELPVDQSEVLDLSPTSPAPVSMQATLAGVTPLPLSHLPSAVVPTIRAVSADLSPLSLPFSSSERHNSDDRSPSTPTSAKYAETAEARHCTPSICPEGSLQDYNGSPARLNASNPFGIASPTACYSGLSPQGDPASLRSPQARSPALSPAVSRVPSRHQLSPFPSASALSRTFGSRENSVPRGVASPEKRPVTLREESPPQSTVERGKPLVFSVAPPFAPVTGRVSPGKRLPFSHPGQPQSSRSPSPSSPTSMFPPRRAPHQQKDHPPLKKNRKSPSSPQPPFALSSTRQSPREDSPSRQEPPQWQIPHLPLPLPPGYPTETAARAVATYNRPSASCSVCSPVSRASDSSLGRKGASPRSSPRTPRSPKLRECSPGSRGRARAGPSPREREPFNTCLDGSPTSRYRGPQAASSNRYSSANSPADREELFLHSGQIVVPPGGVTLKPVNTRPEHSIVHPLVTDDSIAELSLPLAATSCIAQLTELQRSPV